MDGFLELTITCKQMISKSCSQPHSALGAVGAGFERNCSTRGFLKPLLAQLKQYLMLRSQSPQCLSALPVGLHHSAAERVNIPTCESSSEAHKVEFRESLKLQATTDRRAQINATVGRRRAAPRRSSKALP